jgi:hypothetical protein
MATRRADAARRDDDASSSTRRVSCGVLVTDLERCLAKVQADAEAQVQAIEAETRALEQRCEEIRQQLEGAKAKPDDKAPVEKEEVKSLLVNGFPWEASKEALRSAFAPFGAESVFVAHKDGHPSYGFVNFATAAGAAEALRACERQEVLVDDRRGRGWAVKADWQTSPRRGKHRKRGGLLKEVEAGELTP